MGKTYRYRPDDDYQGSGRKRKKSGHSNNKKTRGMKSFGANQSDGSWQNDIDDSEYEYGILSDEPERN